MAKLVEDLARGESLTDAQMRFIDEILINGDPYKSAVNAGYDEQAAKRLAKDFYKFSKIINFIEINKKIESEILNTWLPVAAIAEKSGVPVRTTLGILIKLYNQGRVKMSYSRIDGHNKVHMFKKIETQRILGVVTVIESDVVEL